MRDQNQKWISVDFPRVLTLVTTLKPGALCQLYYTICQRQILARFTHLHFSIIDDEVHPWESLF